MEARSVLAFAFAALFAAPALAPVAAQEGAASEPQITDPEGDARTYTADELRNNAVARCGLGGTTLWKTCESTAPRPEASGGAPAPPSLDIVSAGFRDEGDMLVVDLTVASLGPEFEGLGAETEVLGYYVCWSFVLDDACDQGASFRANRIEGVLDLDQWYFHSTYGCQAAGACALDTPYEIVPGTPGAIRHRIPKAILAESDPVPTIRYAHATTSYATAPSIGVAEYRYTGAEAELGGGSSSEIGSLVDAAGPGRAWTFSAPRRTPDPDRDSVPWWPDAAGDVARVGDGRPDLDVLGIAFAETERTFTFSVQAARVDEVPADHVFLVYAQTTAGSTAGAGYVAKGGARTEFSHACSGWPCVTGPPVQHPPVIDVAAGEPGWVNVTFTRADLGAPRRGDLVANSYAGLLFPEALVQEEAQGVQATRHSLELGDFAWDPAPWWFRLGADKPAADTEDVGVFFADDAGDTQAPVDTALSSADQFDIVSVHAFAAEPGLLRIELGVADLSTIVVPTGYSAVFYAVAVQTERGAFLAGYFKDAQSGSQEFFCGQDKTVLVDPAARQDPHDVLLTPIEGLLAVAQGRGNQGGGGGSEGSIVFLVPYPCLSEEGAGDLVFERVAAGTFVFRSVAARRTAITGVDDIQSEGAVVVPAAVVVATPRPWWAEPFGIDEFWNIFGIAAAVATSAVGAALVQRRRSALKRYLADIDAAAGRPSSREREDALRAVRARLREDLVRGRISDGHFVIVERRLDEQLARSRLDTLMAAFGDLPWRLVDRLQEMLADGVMQPEDFRAFAAMLGTETAVTEEAKAGILRRVQGWVAQDAAVTVPET